MILVIFSAHVHKFSVSDILTDSNLNGIAGRVGSNAVKLAQELGVKEQETKRIDSDDPRFKYHLALSVLKVSALFS